MPQKLDPANIELFFTYLISQGYNIRVMDDEDTLYDLDIAGFSDFLESHSLSGFASSNNDIAMEDLSLCLVEYYRPFIQDENILRGPVRWVARHSHLTYAITPMDSGGLEKPQKGQMILDPEDESQLHLITAAAQLSYNLARRVEWRSYEILQSCLAYEQGPSHPKPHDVHPDPELVLSLAEYACTLRFRFFLHLRNQPVSLAADRAQSHCSDSLQIACRSIASHYLWLRRYLDDSTSVGERRLFRYPGTTGQVVENFPHGESDEELNRWISDGKSLVNQVIVDEDVFPQALPGPAYDTNIYMHNIVE